MLRRIVVRRRANTVQVSAKHAGFHRDTALHTENFA